MNHPARVPTVTPAPAPFFALNAQYLIKPGAGLDDLCVDFRCLYEAGVAVLANDIEKLASSEWAAFYLLRQACAVFDEIEQRLRASSDCPLID